MDDFGILAPVKISLMKPCRAASAPLVGTKKAAPSPLQRWRDYLGRLDQTHQRSVNVLLGNRFLQAAEDHLPTATRRLVLMQAGIEVSQTDLPVLPGVCSQSSLMMQSRDRKKKRPLKGWPHDQKK